MLRRIVASAAVNSARPDRLARNAGHPKGLEVVVKALLVAVVGAVILAIPAAASACPCCDHHHRSEHAAQQPASASAAALAPGEARVTIPVAGMHCAHCVSRVQQALGQIGGVRLAEASLDSGEAVVVYDKSKVKPAKLVDAIDGLGFKAGAPRD